MVTGNRSSFTILLLSSASIETLRVAIRINAEALG
jgi:hypothetical protein